MPKTWFLQLRVGGKGYRMFVAMCFPFLPHSVFPPFLLSHFIFICVCIQVKLDPKSLDWHR